jgi:hypothetical protein
MKIVRLILPALMLIVITHAQAQSSYSWDKSYETALGVRVGGTSGVSIKHMYNNSSAIEGIIGTFGNGFSLTGLIEKHRNAFDAVGLSWYYGGGAHVAFYNGNKYYKVNGREVHDRDNQDVGFGINGIIGLEYVLPDDIPVAFSLDFKPFVEVDSDGDVGVAPDLGIGIKFLIR